jgi:c-di-GMP-binding flagellar brake protein YcgR
MQPPSTGFTNFPKPTLETSAKEKVVERRKHLRIEKKLKVTYDGFKIEGEGETINISGGGMKFRTKEKLLTDRTHFFTFKIPLHGKVQVSATILECVQNDGFFESRVAFEQELCPMEVMKIDSFVHENLPK